MDLAADDRLTAAGGLRVLVVNAGSSSLKHALVDCARTGGGAGAGERLAHGEERWEPGDGPGRHAAALAAALGDAGG
ncbi:MAG: acetate kinase, partial [Gaiellales bacterium]|nr:acetate kinase [Gaiellales bacterium]